MNKELIEFSVKFGLRIKQLREKRGYTQSFLASKLGEGKDKQVVNRYENQGANPSAFQLQQLSEALEFGVQEFYDFSKLNLNEVKELVLKLKQRIV